MTKILSIVPAPLLPLSSGGQKHTYGFLDALGRKIQLVCIADRNSSKEGHSFQLLPLIKHNWLKYISIRNLILLRRQINIENPDLIVLEQPFMGPLLKIAMLGMHIPLYVHSHNVEFYRFKTLRKIWWPLMFLWERWVSNHVNGSFFISKEDKELAEMVFKLPLRKAFVSPYGTALSVGKGDGYLSSKNEINSKYNIHKKQKVLFFFGKLSYEPNWMAVECVLNHILPLLRENYTGQYKLLICGGGLSDEKKQILNSVGEDFIYAGFVKDIDVYTHTADVILNPILTGGGVKTKLIEAVALHKKVVSTETGAIGVDVSVCGNALSIVSDNNWGAFVEECMHENIEVSTPKQFYETYSWDSIANQFLEDIKKAE
jgi:glycosyltransferase involved in cell wall biosynthesis